jgi:chitodextrinase
MSGQWINPATGAVISSFSPSSGSQTLTIPNFNADIVLRIKTGGTPPPTSDTTPPSVPTSLSATTLSSSQINLSWSPSTDNVGVTGYKIYRGGVQVSTSAVNSYSDTGLSPSTAYSYTVSAYDMAGNNSVQSTGASATTQAPTANKFTIGQRVQTTALLNVRATPSTTGTLLGTQAIGNLGTIISGPTNANSFNWWNVNFDTGVDGWSAEDFLVAYTAPATVPVISSFSASPSTITSGQSATLSWVVTGATSLSMSGIGTVTGTSISVSPTLTTTYTLGYMVLQLQV